MKNRYAQVWWTVDDIRDVMPGWTIKQCAKWIDNHEGELRQIVTAVGYKYINDTLKGEEI